MLLAQGILGRIRTGVVDVDAGNDELITGHALQKAKGLMALRTAVPREIPLRVTEPAHSTDEQDKGGQADKGLLVYPFAVWDSEKEIRPAGVCSNTIANGLGRPVRSGAIGG